MFNIIPDQENLTQDTAEKLVYHLYDKGNKAVYKTREEFKGQKRILVYPFNFNRKNGQITAKKIKSIEFKGWDSLITLPKDFKKTIGYGFSSTSSLGRLFSLLTRKFPQVESLTVGINQKTRFSKKTITFDWGDLDTIIKIISKGKTQSDKNRKLLINNSVAKLTAKISKINRVLGAGELNEFIQEFDSFEKISPKDIDSLTKILSDLPSSKILTTAHIIKAKEKIDTVYLDDIISAFDLLMKSSPDDEEAWQKFFTEYTWTLNHLFPFEVILRKGKAYVGGKTIENEEGRIVDFLFESGLKDNFALLEIKTPGKTLLKKSPYREPAVFSVSDELSGGINQCLDQKDSLLRNMGRDYQSFDPKAILVIGQKRKLSKEQAQCFELFRSNQKDVDIVTFDELQSKLVTLYKVITGTLR